VGSTERVKTLGVIGCFWEIIIIKV
jgi:hypothetical protein